MAIVKMHGNSQKYTDIVWLIELLHPMIDDATVKFNYQVYVDLKQMNEKGQHGTVYTRILTTTM